MLNVDYSTTETDDVVSWLSGGVTVTRLIQAHEVVVRGHNGVFRVGGFHDANSRYAAAVLPALLGEEAAGISLKVCARGNVGGVCEWTLRNLCGYGFLPFFSPFFLTLSLPFYLFSVPVWET